MIQILNSRCGITQTTCAFTNEGRSISTGALDPSMKVLMLSSAISSHRGLLLALAAVVAFAACSTTPPVADELDRAKDLTASTLKATEASEVSEFVDELDSHSELSTVEELSLIHI